MIGDSKYVWALKEINFSVKKGEILVLSEKMVLESQLYLKSYLK